MDSECTMPDGSMGRGERRMIGVVADDYTGANDIGVMFAMNGYRCYVYSVYDDASIIDKEADVVVLNTNSRLDPEALAYEKVRAATSTLVKAGCGMFHKKTCSVFRGNIGAEFDAMMDELGADFCAVVLGFPRNGRITRDGLHYVHGRLLEESEFKDDPIHPAKESDLTSILRKQTKRSVALIGSQVVSEGVPAIKAAIEGLRGAFQYVVFDVVSQEALNAIAGALKDERMLAGSSAIGEELPKWLPGRGKGIPRALMARPKREAGTLIVAGSVTPQTRLQVEHARAAGIPALALESEALLDPTRVGGLLDEIAGKAAYEIAEGRDFIVQSENEPEKVRKAKKAAAAAGLDEREAGRLIGSALARITAEVVRRTGLSRLIVLGGETSGNICDALGIIGNLVLKEIAPGVPSVLTIGRAEILMAPKSGSFGKEDFILLANEHLRAIEDDAAAGNEGD
ncbi:MAG: four-carbon acid sugar kinase family protein [Firmicutes bacterium]|nr:four-carbon acid sugar kinase family protein [Bacillota bacterium]